MRMFDPKLVKTYEAKLDALLQNGMGQNWEISEFETRLDCVREQYFQRGLEPSAEDRKLEKQIILRFTNWFNNNINMAAPNLAADSVAGSSPTASVQGDLPQETFLLRLDTMVNRVNTFKDKFMNT